MTSTQSTRFAPMLLGLAVAMGSMIALAPAGATNPGSSTPARPTATHWLCRPGLANNPCIGNLSTLVVPAVGPSIVRTLSLAKHPPVDCFYAYPTVSQQPSLNANLAVEPSEAAIASSQAAPFSQVCRVFAPIYRQVTSRRLSGLATPPARQGLETSYNSLLSGFRAFLAQEPKGRHFVLLGHSQGAAMLIRLIRSQIDPNPSLRSRLLSALIIGGNLTVPKGKKVGGAFRHIPLCSSGHQLGCAIAYSSFSQSDPPGTNALFGIPGQGVSYLWGQTSRAPSLEVACVNPAAFSNGFARLNPRWPDDASMTSQTGYLTYPSLYRSECAWDHGSHYLEVAAEPTTSYPAIVHPNDRPIVQSFGPKWGLHANDVNIAQGDLIAFVARQEFYLLHHR